MVRTQRILQYILCAFIGWDIAMLVFGTPRVPAITGLVLGATLVIVVMVEAQS